MAAQRTIDPLVDKGRDAFARRAWSTAWSALSEADRHAPLVPEDLERLAVASYLVDREQDCEAAWTRAYHDFSARGDVDRAARCAFWQGMMLFDRGQSAQGSGWIAKGRRLLDEHQRECVERGYLLLPTAISSVISGDVPKAAEIFEQAARIGDRFADDDLRALARQGRGRALTMLGNVDEGVSLFDEAMVAVTAHEVSPIAAGVVYCSVIDACMEIFDLKRAQEWTAALNRWCQAQPELLSYRGRCLIHRSEILQWHGGWPDALNEARQACQRLLPAKNQLVTALAFYQLGELHRLRGDFTAAEDHYRNAAERGKNPEPGRALLHLARGRIDTAVDLIRRACETTTQPKVRARVLAAAAEIFVAAADRVAARTAVEELSAIAAAVGAPLIRALSLQASGRLLLAETKPADALIALRDAVGLWRELDIPYEVARTGVLVGEACGRLGDHDAQLVELESARRTLEGLGAMADLAGIKAAAAKSSAKFETLLTTRETEVLRLVATGKTNRGIARQLRISEKTVARHLSNIFAKLGVSTRTAATAYAYRHRMT